MVANDGSGAAGPLLSITNLKTYFHTRNGIVRAVDGVTFEIARGEMLGIVGESGSGKSVTMLSILGLIPMPPGRIEGGSARFDGIDLLQSSPAVLRSIRGRRISMIFQDPMTALNPYMTIGAQLLEPLRIHGACSKVQARAKALAMLNAVGIQDGPDRLKAYPHEFSGGMRQRVMIAMALITKPDLLIADEPTTALDVTVQAQILELIKHLQHDTGTAVALITHDLGVVAETCARVIVMYSGRIMEEAPVEALFSRPRHPYTEALLASLPSRHERGGRLFSIPGSPAALVEPIEGCPFAPRCAKADARCALEPIELKPIGEGRTTACTRVRRGDF